MSLFSSIDPRGRYQVENFLGFVRLACLHMLLSHV